MQTIEAIFGKFRFRGQLALFAIVAAWLAGCASDPADVEDRSFDESPSLQSRAPASTRAPIPGSYRVVKGDTLYSIAFKRGLDYRDVAALNGISAPQYKILVGQELRFSPPGATANPRAATVSPVPHVAAAPTPPPTATTPTQQSAGMFEDVPNAPATSAAAAPEPVESPPAAAKPVPAAPAPVAAEPVAPPTPPKAAPEPPPAKPVNESASSNVGGIAWRWPNGGKVIGTYVAGDQTKQGVDIAGAAGDPVLAAADGEVVYSGNGLLGYGELVIVKHNTNFLSAYGHNRKRLVAEGDKVRAGQQIAEMGSSGSSRDELHFEIRKNGKPVNPLDYLPAR